jgi:hypothetical protein
MPRRIFRLVPTTCIFDKLFSLWVPFIIIRVIKAKRMRWTGHVACMGEKRGAYRVLVGKPEERGHLEVPGVDGRIILR